MNEYQLEILSEQLSFYQSFKKSYYQNDYDNVVDFIGYIKQLSDFEQQHKKMLEKKEQNEIMMKIKQEKIDKEIISYFKFEE